MSARRQDVPGLDPSLRPLVTCEHGGNRVPSRYLRYFEGQEEALESHRGHDPGALVLGRALARALGAPLVSSTVSRLVVELNRSPGHSKLFSEFMQKASADVREEVLARYYHPYRNKVEHLVAEGLREGRRVVHISSHSFTPVMNGEVRNADIGLLYDPGRPGELELASRWEAALKERGPQWRVRRNYPYTGKSDGLCTGLRRHFDAGCYVGIELEINQRFVLAGGPEWLALRRTVVASLLDVLKA